MTHVQPPVAGYEQARAAPPLTASPSPRAGVAVDTTGRARPPVTPGPPPPVPPRRPADQPAPLQESRPRSPLGWLVLSAALLALGVIMLLDLAGTPVATSVYFSIPFAIVGAGLLVGAWRGRARALIALGIVLSIGLAITASIGNWSPTNTDRSVTWQPTSIAQLSNTYEIGGGELNVSATVDVGDLEVRR